MNIVASLSATSQSIGPRINILHETRRIVFHHVPKTAGTSVHVELSRYFSENETCPERADLLDRFTYAELERYLLFSGHYDKHNVDLVPGPKLLVTFLRDPVERILSLYYYWRSYRWSIIEQKSLEGPRFAKSLDLLDFLRCEDRLVRLNIENALARSYIGRQCTATWRVPARGSAEDYAAWALLNLHRYNFIGFVSHFEADMRRLRALLGLPDIPVLELNRFGIIPPIEANVREIIERQPVTAEISVALAELTTIDRPFYEAALAERDELGAAFPN